MAPPRVTLPEGRLPAHRALNPVGADYDVGALHAELERRTDQMPRAPGKMFSRSDILAILRSRVAMANGMAPGSARQNELSDLIHIFENLE